MENNQKNNPEELEFEIQDFFIEEDSVEAEFGGFTTAGSFACVASWGACVSTGSSFSSAGD